MHAICNLVLTGLKTKKKHGYTYICIGIYARVNGYIYVCVHVHMYIMNACMPMYHECVHA